MRSCFLWLLFLLPGIASALALHEGQPLPTVSVGERGELTLQGDKLGYQAWHSSQLMDKVRLIQHIAGRSKAKELNAPLIEAIKAAKLPHDRYQTTTIINLDDALFGTGPFVVSKTEDSKREFPWSSFVLDSNGRVRQQWDLASESSAIILLDKAGKVLFVKEGALSQADISQVMGLIRSQLSRAN